MKTQIRRRKLGMKGEVYHSKIYKGTLLIPDITGFTNFVRKTDIATGKIITSRLLSSIIKSNFLGMKVSEIEGDAILFYKYEVKYSVKEILSQFEVMLESFNEELAMLSEELGEEIDLTLKLIAHYGKLAEYKIGRFQKLYGETVIEAHKLLKNNVSSSSYVLITDDLLDKTENSEVCNENISIGKRLSNSYKDIKNMSFTFFDYQIPKFNELIA